MSNARAKSGTMCPVKTVDRPGIAMLHTWVDLTFLPLGKFIVDGFKVVHLLTMLTLSMMKMDVAPVSVIACKGAIVKAFKASCLVGLSKMPAAATHLRGHIRRCVWNRF